MLEAESIGHSEARSRIDDDVFGERSVSTKSDERLIRSLAEHRSTSLALVAGDVDTNRADRTDPVANLPARHALAKLLDRASCLVRARQWKLAAAEAIGLDHEVRVAEAVIVSC